MFWTSLLPAPVPVAEVGRRVGRPQLQELPWLGLGGCSRKELARTADLLMDVWVEPGQVLLREGGLVRQGFLLADRPLALRVTGQPTRMVGRGSTVGVPELATGARSGFTLSAVGRTRVFVVGPHDWQRLRASAPGAADALLLADVLG